MPNPEPITLTPDVIRPFMPTRTPDDYKWSVGSVVIVAGSPDYPGAAILASRAAGRAGAGVVTLATPRNVTAMVASAIPEVVHASYGETESQSGAHRAIETISKHLQKARAVVIGPGLGNDAPADTLLSALFGLGTRTEHARGRMGFGASVQTVSNQEQGDSPLFSIENLHVVIDADGLRWLATQPEWWKSIPAGRMVLTPHPSEMARLLDRPVDEITANPIGIAEDAARTWKQVVLLKGGHPVVTDGKTTYVGEASRPSLATAGSGDVLAGSVGALIAQTGKLLEAAAIAATVGPIAATQLEATYGMGGVIASDLSDAMARAIASLS